MVEPIRWRNKIVLAKIESNYGVDPGPTGAANAILMTDVALQPMEGEDESRDLLRGYFGNQETIPAGLRAVLSGSTELAGSGAAGTAPAWGPLARACGLAEIVEAGVDVTYSPVTEDHESVTIHFWMGNTRHVLTGARGNAVIEIPAQGIPRIRWSLTGIFADPAEQAQATPNFAAWKRPLIASSTNTPVFTVGGVSLVARNVSLDLGNEVQSRFLIGRHEIRIVEKRETIAANVEAVPLTTFNPFDKARKGANGGLVAVAVVHGTTAGSIVTVDAPACQVQRPGGFEQQQNLVEWPLRLAPQPSAGDDQFTITLT